MLRVLLALLAAVLVGSAPATANAGWLGFRNETKSAVVVQISHESAARLQHGKPHLLNPGNVTWERVLQPGKKWITIYDPAQPRRVLFKGPLLYAGNDLFFAIQQEETPAGLPVTPVTPPAALKLAPAKLAGPAGLAPGPPGPPGP